MKEPSIRHALRDLRHLYEQMLDGRVRDTAEAARGLLGPGIVAAEQADAGLERAAAQLERLRALLRRTQAALRATDPGERWIALHADIDAALYAD